MNAPKFTPGPYSVDYAMCAGQILPAVRAADGDMLALGCTESDATLFAASPALYAALEQAVTSMQDSGYSNENVAVRAARAALAQALGESP